MKTRQLNVGFLLLIVNSESTMKKSIFTDIIREEVSRLFEADPPAQPNLPASNKPPAEDGSEAAQQAHHLNLAHTGYGNWAQANDPEGKTVAQTIKGHLVKVVDKDQPNQAQGGEQPSAQQPAAPSQAPQATAPSTPKAPAPAPRRQFKPIDADDYTSPSPSALAGTRPNRYNIKDLQPDAASSHKIGQQAIKKWGSSDAAAQQLQQLSTKTTNPATKQSLDTAAKILKKEPGSINPPKTKDGKPWEVVDGAGKPGVIDFTDNKGNQAHVTYDDGTSGMVRFDQLKPRSGPEKPYQVPEPDKKPIYPGDQGESDYPWRQGS
jgi:hypothetical protein